MRTQKELSSFIVLRSNGWSLARISKHLNIPKTTLFHWEEKNAETIHLLKYVQLEKIQEQYVPSYEEQLKDTHQHLQRIQAALQQQDYSKMSPEFLLQMNFQLQTRLDKIRQQVPLRSPQFGSPIEALPPIGCVTRDEHFPRAGELSDPDPSVEGEPELEPAESAASTPVAAPPERPADHEPRTTRLNGNGHANGNGNGHHHANGSLAKNQNGTFRNENPRGVENGSLSINDLQPPKRNDRSI